MTAQLVRVPDGKREHIGVLIDHSWQPICGQLSGVLFHPLSAFGSWLTEDRRTTGTCRDCVTAAGAIHDLAQEATQ